MIYEDFPLIPLILVITLQNRKTLFCVFLCFRNLPKLKWSGIFRALIFYHENLLEHKKSARWATRAKWGQVAQAPGRATQACLSLEAPMLSIFVSWSSAWPKNDYIKTPPLVFSRGGGGETWNKETEAVPGKIGEGNAVRVTPGCFSNPSDINTIDTSMKRE
jgi:hypothetical protein